MTGSHIFSAAQRPCWHCHWFGYLMAENSHGTCLNPRAVPMVATPRTGCAHWRREPGADDAMSAPPALRPGSQARARIDAERARLDRIQEHGSRVKLTPGVYAVCMDRSGLLGVGGYREPEDVGAAEAAIERLGVNAAIRAGRL